MMMQQNNESGASSLQQRPDLDTLPVFQQNRLQGGGTMQRTESLEYS